MYPRILVAIDGSEAARTALGEAIRLARTLGSRVRLLHVVNRAAWVPPDADPSVLQHVIDDLRGTGESLLHEATSAARAASIEVDSRLIEALGAPAGEVIVREAASWPASLIVCGTHGHRGLRRLLMGSDAELIVRHCPVPVLLVHAASTRVSAASGTEQ